MVAALLYEPFPLWQALQARPERAGTPAVVVQHDRVLYASAEAKRCGAQAGMSVTAAQLRVQGLEVIPHNGPRLQAAWEGCLETLHALTPRLEPLALGRVLALLEPADARQLAGAYRIRAGVATSREVALVAALTAFSATARVVEPGCDEAFLRTVPVRFLGGLGLSPETLRRLAWLGVERLGDLMAWRYTQLEAFVGPEARLLKPCLYGPWREGVALYRPPPRCRAVHTFEDEAREPCEVLPVLAKLARQASAALDGRTASRLTLTAFIGGVAFPAARLAKRPLREEGEILRLATLALEDTNALPLSVTALELELCGLSRPAHQGRLWDAKASRERAVAMVHARFPGALYSLRLKDPYSLAPELTHEKVALGEEVTDAPGPEPYHGGAGRGRKAPQAALRR